MKLFMLPSVRTFVHAGIIWAAAIPAVSQGAAIQPLGLQDKLALMAGAKFHDGPFAGSLSLPCGQNRLTALEQLQNGATLSKIIEEEQNVAACKVNPAVVEIIAYGFGAIPGQEYVNAASAIPGRSIGTGVVVSSDGFIVTNRHVIRNAPRISVVLHSYDKPDEQVLAELVGEDEETDLAVLRIARTGLPFLEFNRQPVRQGDTVFAFGSPHGVGISMTKGVISASTRQVKDEDQQDYIQTDAAINKGNSGGALVDIGGKLVGINSFIMSVSGGNEGINFAIPSPVVFQIYNQIKSSGFVIRGTIGVTTRNLTPELNSALKIPLQVGVYIEDVEPNGPAEAAGMEIGDIVVGYEGIPLQIDERTPDPAWELRRAITRRIRGATIQLEVFRDGIEKSFNVVVNQSARGQIENPPQLSNDFLIESLGIYGLKMTSSVATQRNLRSHEGVLVSIKTPALQAQATGLQLHDLITQINGEPVTELDDIRKVMDGAESGHTVFVNVERDRKMQLVAILIN